MNIHVQLIDTKCDVKTYMNRLKEDNFYVTSCLIDDSEFNKRNRMGGGSPG